MIKSKSKVLVIPDLHCPADHPEALDFLRWTREQFDCDTVMSIGDVSDFLSITFHQVAPEAPSPKQEIDLTVAGLQKYHDEFPGIKVVAGNHDMRVARKAASSQIPYLALRSLCDIIGVPSWEFVPELELDGVLYRHGAGGGVNGASRLALKMQMPVVAGHIHSAFGVAYTGRGIWGLQVGTLIDYNDMRFDYGRQGTYVNHLGCGVVLEGHTPIAVPFKAFEERKRPR